jgi:hypothetical protein
MKWFWIVFLIFLCWLNFYPEPKHKRDWPEKQIVTKRLLYHGIYGAEPDGKGWYYFMRNGKKHRL